ncbi:hypothetical protein Pmani_012991 [Petrolisthes manimaculis]|uniref:Transposase Tc1-like domain-containing protein n=1 Tax=Petrolisthes manimaculis TaxID=1843537 RepID=A0AAE1UA09_9EUCA|nr:hypothetical protein Pmani_012991 [Petrolisthes manimaculis]
MGDHSSGFTCRLNPNQLLAPCSPLGMDIQGRRHGQRPPNNRANRPEVITRRALIMGNYDAGKSINEISRLMGISKTTVRLWIRRYEGEGQVMTRPRSGRPKVNSQDDEDRLIAAARQSPKTTAVSWTRELQLPCHPITTRRRLQEAGLDCHVPAVKEQLTEANKLARLTFAQQYVQHDINFWENVIFTDEKSFSSVAATGRHCWRFPNTRYKARNISARSRSGRVSVSFHGWMWAAGPGELEWQVPEKTLEAIERKAQEVWESIRRRPNICTNLVNSMPSRLQGVIEAQGGWTKN